MRLDAARAQSRTGRAIRRHISRTEPGVVTVIVGSFYDSFYVQRQRANDGFPLSGPFRKLEGNEHNLVRGYTDWMPEAE